MNMKLVIEADSTTLVRILKLLDDAPTAPISEEQLELPTVTVTQSATTPVTVTQSAAPEYTPTPPTTTDEPIFDDTGLVWDERIHAPSKTKTADGSWRKRRNTDDAVYKAVEAELRALHGQTAPVEVAPEPAPQGDFAAAPAIPVITPIAFPPFAPEIATQPVTSEPAPVGNVAPVPTVSGVVAVETVTNEPVPVMPSAPVVTPVAAPVAAIDFHGLMQEVGQRITAGTVTPDQLNQIIGSISAQYGVPLNTFTDLAAQPTLIPVAHAMLVSAQ